MPYAHDLLAHRQTHTCFNCKIKIISNLLLFRDRVNACPNMTTTTTTKIKCHLYLFHACLAAVYYNDPKS